MPVMDSAHELRTTLLQNLKSGRWRAGERLPPERLLSHQFRLSRTTVRRVLAELKEQGLITQTVGSGTYVTGHAGNAISISVAPDRAPGQVTSPAELMEARLVIEPAIVEMVIGNATPADFARLEDCCAKAEAAKSIEEFERWDGRLHEAIADAAHNAFVSSVFRLMNEVRSQGEWGLLKKRSLTRQRRVEYQNEHRRIVTAIKERDVARARELSLAHLLHVRRNLLGY
jgi:DNA-binding FadR family transcriptional regulator